LKKWESKKKTGNEKRFELTIGRFQMADKGSIKNIRKLHPAGTLWFLDYTMDYQSSPFVRTALEFVKKFGCSAFLTENENGEVMTCRNYDFPHKDANGDVTGQNVVLRFHPKGGYESLCVADAAMLKRLKLPFFKGTPESGPLGRMPYKLLPYLCMDGMNEKGLAISILVVDLKKGEEKTSQKTPGRKIVLITELLREALDRCASVTEVIRLAQNVNLRGALHIEAHLFVTDETGASVVLEWRHQNLQVIRTNVVTNFYVGYDDAEDCWRKGKCKERFILPSKYTLEYHYGYGHGYDRFKGIAEDLEAHLESAQPYRTVMSKEECFKTLEKVSQEFEYSDITSFTQYSIIYNHTKRTADLCLGRDYEKVYSFSVKDNTVTEN